MGFDWIAPKNYKRHYICLGCQKGFKRASEKDMTHSKSTDLTELMNKYYASESSQDIVKYIEDAYQRMKVVCPNCKSLMIQVHYNFEVPPQRDSKSWKHLQNTMSSETKIQYDLFIKWHNKELQKEDCNSIKLDLLKQNLSQLEKMI